MKEYKRNCPKCGRELTYSCKRNLNRAIENNSNCARCKTVSDEMRKYFSEKNKGRKYPNYKRRPKEERPVNFVRNCPDCGNEMPYVKEYSYKEANKKNSKCDGCRMKHRIKETGSSWILTQDQINKMAAKKAGYDTFEEYIGNISEFKKYKRKVMSITNKQPVQTLENFEKRGKMGVEGAYNIDHIYSIYRGFRDKIEPKVIGDIKNLEMIPWLDNIQKHKN